MDALSSRPRKWNRTLNLHSKKHKKKDYLHSLLAAHPYHHCRCSPNNSDDEEEEEDVDDKEGGEMGTTGLVLGHSDKSKDESDD